ncbi:WecB/TagA/CpsF family glycosyltransferase [Enterococcus rivorum]|uniref:WecB/TagA/CpsF family glycosyltransferase n=1 Tax=Enterococcus rivorum TaxID=762845 RepID=UPI0036343089
MDAEINEKKNIFNININCLTMKETLRIIEESIEKRTKIHHVSINAHKVNLINKDSCLEAIVDKANLVNADGSSILLAGKVLGVNIPERVTGVDLFINLLKICETNGYRAYFFGAEEESLHCMIKNIKRDYPKLQIAGFRNGYFESKDNDDIVKNMNESKADVLFVAFSSPKKEYWINNNESKLNIPFLMGVGGSFDILSGVTKRAPGIFQKYGLEWLYRFINEPKRMFHRYFFGNGKFLILLIKEYAKKKRRSFLERCN